MLDDHKKSILYRPDLKLPKNYNTDNSFIAPDQDNIIQEQVTQKQDLIERAEQLKASLLFMPGAIKPATESILDLVLFILILNDSSDDKNDNKDDSDEEWEITTPDVNPPIIKDPDSNQENSDLDDFDLNEIFKDGHKPKTIMKQTVSDSAKINKFYSRSTLDISRHYVDRLGEILATYHTNLIIQPELEETLEMIYNAPLLDYSNQVAHSILQGLLKSQQQKINKMRLYQKLYNQKESLTILKSLEYSKLTLLKLSNKDNIPKNNRLYYKHAQILEGERHKLDKKLFEYYRYLDSSLEALDMLLNMHITEAIAKVELNLIHLETESELDKENSKT